MLINLEATTMPVEQFQADLKSICGNFEVVAKEDCNSVKGRIGLERRAGIEMAHVANDVHVVRRTIQDIRRDPGDHFFLIVQEEGHALMQQNGVTCMLKPGDMILIDSAAPSQFTFFGDYNRQLSLHLPRNDMNERYGQAAVGGRHAQRTDYHAVAMSAVLAKAFDVGTNDVQTSYLKEAVFGLIGAMLYEQTPEAERSKIEVEFSRTELFERGIAYMDRCFTDSALTTQSMSEALGVSVRQMQRAFTLAGTTPTEYLLKKRIEKACQMLAKRSTEREPKLISSIAYSCGFNDISYFNRQFRRLFGCAPGQFCENAGIH